MTETGKSAFVTPSIGKIELSGIPEFTAPDTPEMKKWYKFTDPTTNPEAPLILWLDFDDPMCCGMIMVYLKYGNPPPDISCIGFYTSVEAISEVDTLPAEVVEPALVALNAFLVPSWWEEWKGIITIVGVIMAAILVARKILKKGI